MNPLRARTDLSFCPDFPLMTLNTDFTEMANTTSMVLTSAGHDCNDHPDNPAG
jgi:hypothetical protein